MWRKGWPWPRARDREGGGGARSRHSRSLDVGITHLPKRTTEMGRVRAKELHSASGPLGRLAHPHLWAGLYRYLRGSLHWLKVSQMVTNGVRLGLADIIII